MYEAEAAIDQSEKVMRKYSAFRDLLRIIMIAVVPALLIGLNYVFQGWIQAVTTPVNPAAFTKELQPAQKRIL